MSLLRPRPAALAAGLAVLMVSQCGCTLTSKILGSPKREVYRFERTFSAGDAAFRRSMETFGYGMVGGNSVRLLVNGDEIFTAMIGAIRRARVSVNLETFRFKDDRAGRFFADELIAAARRGVTVRVLVDGFGGRAGDLREPMKAAGVDVRVYRPFRLWSRPSPRTHRKALVVDGELCFTGGLGIDRRWLGDARSPDQWHDIQVEVRGPVVAQMQAVFAENWTFTTREILAGESLYPELRPVGNVFAQAIKVSRGDASSLPRMLYVLAIESAARSIRIQNAYFLPGRQVRQALARAVARGVRVEVMVPGRHTNVPLVRVAARAQYGELLASGVRVYEYAPTMLHNKVLVVDGVFALVGSINLDALSMTTNAEEGLAVHDRAFAAELEKMFEEDLRSCREVTEADWKKRGLGHRIAEVFAGLWEPLY